MSGSRSDSLTPAERDRLAAFREAESLAALVDLMGADDEHEAYFAAKREWRDLRDAELAAAPANEASAGEAAATDQPAGPGETAGQGDGLPGARVTVDGTTFHVHGVTHAGTDAERAYLRAHVRDVIGDGAAVFCEQGIRRMYFDDVDGVREMDDYRWAMRRCEVLDDDSILEAVPGTAVDELVEDVTSLAAEFRETTFALVESGTSVYGEEFADALGDVASTFLTSHENLGTGQEFASFAAHRRAAEDPARLGELQRYYERSFLPQPLEREWLRRHDPELEIVTHARNERMADYAVSHAGSVDDVHLIVGAAHQPGVRYYLERHRDGERDGSGFEPVP